MSAQHESSELSGQSYRDADVVSVYEAPDHEQIARMVMALSWYAKTSTDLAELAGLEGRHQAISGLLRRLEANGLAQHDAGSWWTTSAAAVMADVLRSQRHG